MEQEAPLEAAVLLLLLSHSYIYYNTYFDRLVVNEDSTFGARYVEDLVEHAHLRRAYEVLRMPVLCFLSLHDWLIDNTNLRSSSS
jgi:hypothetical protein